MGGLTARGGFAVAAEGSTIAYSPTSRIELDTARAGTGQMERTSLSSQRRRHEVNDHSPLGTRSDREAAGL